MDKKILAIVLALFLALSFVACSKRSKDDNDTSSSSSLTETNDSLQDENSKTYSDSVNSMEKAQTGANEPEGKTQAEKDETNQSGDKKIPDYSLVKPSYDVETKKTVPPTVVTTQPNYTFTLPTQTTATFTVPPHITQPTIPIITLP